MQTIYEHQQMMKTMLLVMVISFFILLTGCSKDKTDPIVPPTPAIGTWRGYAFGFNTILINKPDGTARIYFGNLGFDTTASIAKFNGTYTADQSIYSAKYSNVTDTINFELMLKTPRYMAGAFFANNGFFGPVELGKP